LTTWGTKLEVERMPAIVARKVGSQSGMSVVSHVSR
jgi:hypothetical protein